MNSKKSDGNPGAGAALAGLFDMQGETLREIMSDWPLAGAFAGMAPASGPGGSTPSGKDGGDGAGDGPREEVGEGLMSRALALLTPPSGEELGEWARSASEMQAIWLDYLAGKAREPIEKGNPFDPAQWMLVAQGLLRHMPQPPLDLGARMAAESLELWQKALGQLAGAVDPAGAAEALAAANWPRQDRRFSDPAWTRHPGFALLHQTYLMLGEYFTRAVEEMEGLDPEKRKQLRLAVNLLVEAMSPANFILTNPVVLQRTIETRGQNLVRGMRHLIDDMRRGQLTHTDRNAFELGRNLAATPGKVVHETPLYQLIQYTPTTEKVIETPLVIFPPWINRFYILDLTEKKSFVKWALDQGVSVFMVSWRSADASMREVSWDDYIRAQIEVIDHVRKRLGVPCVHTIGYCVAGTTLAATLAVLARRGEADKVRSATFFTAQVDFERSGDLKAFIDDGQLKLVEELSRDGYLDGRYMAAAFNALRGKDLIWNYVVNNYLLGEDYPAFDLLYWNGDVTNLPARWHLEYLRDLYRDNKLAVPDALQADGTPIDLTRIQTPSYIQAGREDHIAPPESVWRLTRHLRGPRQFLLAGSGHIAGVINPPAVNKYQYWTGNSEAESYEDFLASAIEHPGSWWPHWLEWLRSHGDRLVPATGKRKPGSRADKVIEDAPGRYVKMR